MASNSIEAKRQIKAALKLALPASAMGPIRDKRLQSRERRASQNLTPNRYEGTFAFTVVSAVYNIDPYLDDFFTSLFTQTIKQNNLRIIMVDDGSTDESAEVIKRWQQQWPGAILYLKKENGGQASARNYGLNYVETEWVTFIDPDDFVSRDYFEHVDRAIAAQPSLQMVACNPYYYHEESQTFSNTHPLKNKFKDGDSFFGCGDEQTFVQLFMNSAFFRMSQIRKNDIQISETIKPNFEDGLFVNEYMLALEEGTVGFLKQPHYYYRKREDNSSTIDTSWETLDKYINAPKNGHLALLEMAQARLGRVPRNIQETIVYDLSWYFRYLVGRTRCQELVNDPAHLKEFFEILREIFSYIDQDVLFGFAGRLLPFEYKCGIGQTFASLTPPFQIAYLKRVNFAKKELLIETLSDEISFYINGKQVSPLSSKEVRRTFCGQSFYTKRESWVPYGSASDVLSYRLGDGTEVRLSVNGTQFKRSTPINELFAKYKENWRSYKQQGDTWLIMDRDTQADDNGEHFYRYMKENHPEQKCIFALRKDSPNWERLAAEGFNLVAFGTKSHEKALKACSKIISSHADAYVHSYFGDNFYKSKDYVFLQHGVTHNDISNWINSKPISMLSTVTEREYHSIVDDDTPYTLTSEQVTLSGFARHDALLRKHEEADARERMILIAPTWREFLMGKTIGKGNARFLNDEFAESEYARAWNSLLASDQLRDMADRDGYRIVFFPHANILPYVEKGDFSIPPYVEIGSCVTTSIQEYLSKASVCITDYSSVAFDIAYLHTPCIYYQFDRERMYAGGHICSRGYFDYDVDGFGPVAMTEEELTQALSEVADNDFRPTETYLKRMEETFILRDGKCCERIYEAITGLDKARK